MRGASLLAVCLFAPASAAAHPLLGVGFSDGGATIVLSCGLTRSEEPVCSPEGTCEMGAGDCFDVQDLSGRYCLTGDMLICCDDAGASQCPLIDGYDVRCVFIDSGPGVRVEGTVGLCIYDIAGSTSCADRAAVDPAFAVQCLVSPGGTEPDRLAPFGDCDEDGLKNDEETEPCEAPSARDAGPGPMPGMDTGPGPIVPPEAVASLRFHGAGGCECSAAARGSHDAAGLFFVAFAGAWGATRVRRRRSPGRSR